MPELTGIPWPLALFVILAVLRSQSVAYGLLAGVACVGTGLVYFKESPSTYAAFIMLLLVILGAHFLIRSIIHVWLKRGKRA